MKRLFRSFTRPLGVRGFSTRQNELQIDGVKHTIAVASAKGGVGKSTTAVNVAVVLARNCQLRVGLLDADVYGPSVPTMMKIHGKPELTEDRKIVPVANYGVKCMSIGLLVDNNAALVWRSNGMHLTSVPLQAQGVSGSPMTLGAALVSSALEKMTRGVAWGDLDILVVDMPPGTGDPQITMCQRLSLSGALIVSTPQDVALMDARRGIKMFSNVNIPILGVVENMSCFVCPHCGEPSYIFGKGGSRKTADEMGIGFLGEVPLEVDIRKCCDEGVPAVVSAPDSVASKAYLEIGQKVMNRLQIMEKEEQLHPKISL